MDLVKYLRQSVIVQDPNGINNDPEFLEMSDEDLKDILQFSLYKLGTYSIDDVPEKLIYPLILVAKKELYSILAVKNSPMVTIGVGETAIKYENRFEHYLKLIKQVEEEYNIYTTQNQFAESGEVILNNRYYSKRNYDLSTPPSVKLKLDNVDKNFAEISWEVENIDKFHSYKIYLDTQSILDKYSTYKISSTAVCLDTIYDIHNTMYRVENLTSNTKYYVLVVVQNRNGLKGYSEIEFTTLI